MIRGVILAGDTGRWAWDKVDDKVGDKGGVLPRARAGIHWRVLGEDRAACKAGEGGLGKRAVT